MNKRIIIKVFGLVQGVFFRAFAAEKARELGLVGWVRNAPNGTVEIVVEGEEENLKKLIEYCHEGPRFAKVKEVKIEWGEATNEFNDFRIQYE